MPASSYEPLVFAHRGASITRPEHTLAAYQQALAEGADGVECDVRLTVDGHLVCVHDRRLERTSNGRGPVSEHSLAQLDDLDFESWHPNWPESADDLVLQPRERARVLTLERLLHAVCDAGRPVHVLIETKHPTRYGGQVEQRLVELLRTFELHRGGTGPVRVTVMSFALSAIRRVHTLAPDLPTVLLLEILPPWLRDGRLPAGVSIAGPGIRLLRARPALARRLHRQGNQLYVWTVNSAEDLDLVVELEADGIISDQPRQVMDRLGR